MSLTPRLGSTRISKVCLASPIEFGHLSFIYFIDEPEIHVDKAWIHADVGVEVEISCIVHAEPRAEVSNDQRKEPG